tara:strand:+ start:87 stop:437 length:351 start_codon:yes stop_codon:yes gene_type:complete
MNVSLAGLVGISIYKMLVMQLISCMTLVYLNQLLSREKKCNKAQGTWFRNQVSRSQGSWIKAQGSRRKPSFARLKALAPEYMDIPLPPRGVAMINEVPPFVLWLICHDICPLDNPI